MQNITFTPPVTGLPEKKKRERQLSPLEKQKKVISLLKKLKYKPGEFLYDFLDDSLKHDHDWNQSMSRFLGGGQTNIKPVDIVNLIYVHHHSIPPSDHADMDGYFSLEMSPAAVAHAQPSLSAWAFQMVCRHAEKEVEFLCSEKAGLRVRASNAAAKRAQEQAAKSAADGYTGSGGSTPVDAGGHNSEHHDTRRDWEVADVGVGSGNQHSAPICDGDHVEVATGEHEYMGIDSGLNASMDTTYLIPGSFPADDTEEAVLEDSYVDCDEGVDLPEPATQRQTKRRRVAHDPLVTWDIVGNVSFKSMGALFKKKAPILWGMLHRLTGSEEAKDSSTYRPKDGVCTSIISEIAYTKNSWTNLFPLCRSITLFATKAHQSSYRVASRLAQCTPYSTTYAALETMAEQARGTIQSLVARGKQISLVMDNVQAYARRRDARIGLRNKMVVGTGATAVELEDCEEGAFELDTIAQQIKKGERRSLTVETIADDIDTMHFDKVFMYHFLDALVTFVPALYDYRSEVSKRFDEDTQKHQINPKRHTKVHPLGTNSANEVSTQGMKEALSDFLDQLGITEQTFDDRAIFIHGDGKSFEAMHKIGKYLSTQLKKFNTMRFIRPVLELWHTKWTDLSRILRGHWGGEHNKRDPSTLGFMARAINSPTPADLHKVEYYPNARLVDVTVRGHILNCWENHFRTSDLVRYFQSLADVKKLPSLNQLIEDARTLSKLYCGTQAHLRALHPGLSPECDFPVAESNSPPCTTGRSESSMNDGTSVAPGPSSGGSSNVNAHHTAEANIPCATKDAAVPNGMAFEGDWPLANSALLMRDGIWFLEVCRAVALGDIGRVWEVMKIWIFTFSGAGNSNYSPYLIELFCNFKYEYPEATKKALFNNWLVNLAGKIGHFLELDLMQEHFNHWLEELAQHKGKEFDENWYRNVLSMHVHFFLRLIDEMEKNVDLKPRRKEHSAPHLMNELREVMRICRDADLHRRHIGRDLGFRAVDHYEEGFKKLGAQGKLADYIKKSMHAQDNESVLLEPQEEYIDATTYLHAPATCVDGRVDFSD